MCGESEKKLYVAASTIRGAGGGLFAGARIRKGECVAVYKGHIVPRHKALGPDYDRSYLMQTGNVLHDGRDPAGRLQLQNGKIVNVHTFSNADWRRLNVKGVKWIGVGGCARFANHGSAARRNIKLAVGSCGKCGYVARRHIDVGEELLTDYGPDYWNSQNSEFCAKCGYPGLLLQCDGLHCHRSFHLQCAQILKVPPGAWRCNTCLKRGTPCITPVKIER